MVDHLVEDIAKHRERLNVLEQQLKEIQRQCAHQFIEKVTYRICQKCKAVESYHY